MKLEKTLPTLAPLVLSLGIAFCAIPAGAQQPSVDSLRREAESAAAQAAQPEAEAAQRKFREAMDQARSDAGAPSAATDGAARPDATQATAGRTIVPGTASPMTVTPQIQSAASAASGGANTIPVPAGAPQANAGSAAANGQRIVIPPASGVGVNAPFAHDYFARFEGKPKAATAPLLDGIGLRGTVQAASLQQKIDEDLAHERPQMDDQNHAARAAGAGRRQGQAREPFNPLVQNAAATAEKPRRAPKPPFEELN